MTTLTEDVIELRELRELRDDAKSEYDDLKAKYDEKEADVFARMEEEGAEAVRAAGVTFSPTRTVYGQINDREQFIKWAETNAPELIETKERKGLINQEARRHVDDGDPLPPGMTFYVKEFIGQRAT